MEGQKVRWRKCKGDRNNQEKEQYKMMYSQGKNMLHIGKFNKFIFIWLFFNQLSGSSNIYNALKKVKSGL